MTHYKYDTHVHTAETSPCGRVHSSEVVRLYKDAGYTGIVITDHYYDSYFESLQGKTWNQKIDIYLSGYNNAAEQGSKLGLDVILGTELRFSENCNDYLVYGINKDFLRKEKELYRLGLKKFRDMYRDTGIMIYQAHPFRPSIVPANPALLDGVEVFNGNPRQNSQNDKALGFARENKLKMISGSDFHQIGDLARGGVVLKERVTEASSFAEFLRKDRISELITSD